MNQIFSFVRQIGGHWMKAINQGQLKGETKHNIQTNRNV